MTHTPTDAMIEAAWETLRSAMIPTPRFHDKNCWKQATKDVLQAALAQQQPSGEVVGYLYEVDEGDGFCWAISIEHPADTPHHYRNVRPVTYADTTALCAPDSAPDHIPDAGKMVAPEGEGLVGELACLGCHTSKPGPVDPSDMSESYVKVPWDLRDRILPALRASDRGSQA